MSVEDGKPILDPEKWRAGTDLDREMWTLAGRERLLAELRKTVAICRRHFYDPADPDDWTVPDLERRLARVEEAMRDPYDHPALVRALADFIAEIPEELAS